MEERNSLFRKSNMDRISSPERLNDYIKATSPGVWIILLAVIILLAAAVFWGFTFQLDESGLRPIDFLLSMEASVCRTAG